MFEPSVGRSSLVSRAAASFKRSAVLSVIVLAMAGCKDSPTNPAPSAVWKADLTGTESFSDLQGAVEVPVWPAAIRPKVTLTKAGSEKSYVWRVAGGTCADPDSIVGKAEDYEEIKTDTAGAASVTVIVGATLDDDEEYHVSVHPKEQVSTIAACSDLARQ